MSYGLIAVLIFVFFDAADTDPGVDVAAVTAAVIALVMASTRDVKVAAGTPPTSGSGASSVLPSPAAPLGPLRVDILRVRRLVGVAEKSDGYDKLWLYGRF